MKRDLCILARRCRGDADGDGSVCVCVCVQRVKHASVCLLPSYSVEARGRLGGIGRTI